MEAQKVILIIMDGWGSAPAWGGNAVEMAETPNFDNYWRKYPHVLLKAAEESVGLPTHEPGNSEVGHLNIGSGQAVRQNLPGITAEINNGNFAKNPQLLEAINHAKRNNSNLHLIGLVSDGGVHSHIDHLFALLDLCQKEKFKKVFIHVITDGRDTDPMKALSYLSLLDQKLKEIKFGRIESIMGRYYAMDRDNRWDRIKKAYEVIVKAIGPKAETADKAISASYRANQTDEFIAPVILETEKEKFVPIGANDSVIFFNFRFDRTRELSAALTQSDFSDFNRGKMLDNLYFASFAFHEAQEVNLPVHVVFKPSAIINPLAQVIADHNLKQLHVAETEKFAHITYFFNGGKEPPFPHEERILVPSPKVATYDLKPEMSAVRVADEVLEKFTKFDFVVINFANPDMVGHTGDLKATVKACETVDECIGKIVKAAFEKKYLVFLTADHGNAEQMINPNTGEPHTEHTINQVPFLILSEDPSYLSPLVTQNRSLALSDIAPTILKAMKIEIPKEMTGKSLLD